MKAKIVSAVAAVLIAGASYLTLGTPLGDALQIALNTDKAVEACAAILQPKE